MRNIRRYAALAAKALAGALAVLALSGTPAIDDVAKVVGTEAEPADAANPAVYRNAGNHWTPMYGLPGGYRGDVVRVWMAPHERFQMQCWLDVRYGTTGNYYTRRWFAGWAFGQGQWGYVHASYVYNQIRVPHC